MAPFVGIQAVLGDERAADHRVVIHGVLEQAAQSNEHHRQLGRTAGVRHASRIGYATSWAKSDRRVHIGHGEPNFSTPSAFARPPCIAGLLDVDADDTQLSRKETSGWATGRTAEAASGSMDRSRAENRRTGMARRLGWSAARAHGGRSRNLPRAPPSCASALLAIRSIRAETSAGGSAAPRRGAAQGIWRARRPARERFPLTTERVERMRRTPVAPGAPGTNALLRPFRHPTESPAASSPGATPALPLRRSDPAALLEETIGANFRRLAAQYPDNGRSSPATRACGLTYRDLDRQTQQLASALLNLGLAKGDRIGIWAHNRVSGCSPGRHRWGSGSSS